MTSRSFHPTESTRSIVSGSESKKSKGLNKTHGVLFIAAMEIVGSVATFLVYIYGMYFKPNLYSSLVPYFTHLSNDDALIRGVMYTVMLMSIMELILSLLLFYGASQEQLDMVYGWVCSMTMFLVMATIIIFGMDLGGIHCPRMDFIASISILVRLLEIFVVNTWVKEKKQEQRIRAEENIRRLMLEKNRESISTGASASMDEESGIDPPSYECTFPSCSWDHLPPRGLSTIAEHP